MIDHPDTSKDEPTMDAMTTYAAAEPDVGYDDDIDEFGQASVPGRPRRVLVNRYSVGLVTVLIGAVCFYGGVHAEKAKVGTGSTATAGAITSKLAARSGSFTGTPGAGASGASGASGTAGTIATISGDTVDVTESSGATVKVKLSDATTLTKTVTVGKSSLYPGDTVTITGATGKDGTVTATAVTDSGASDSSTSSSATSSSTSSSSSSGLTSLFGSN